MLTDYARNKIVDWYFRGQSLAPPARWIGLLAAGATAAGGTAVTGGGLARVAAGASLVTWSGTQAEGSTAVSSGATGLTSNNGDLTLAASLSASKTASFVGVWDAEVGGNLLEIYPLTDTDGNEISRTWNVGDPVVINAGDFEITVS